MIHAIKSVSQFIALKENNVEAFCQYEAGELEDENCSAFGKAIILGMEMRSCYFYYRFKYFCLSDCKKCLERNNWKCSRWSSTWRKFEVTGRQRWVSGLFLIWALSSAELAPLSTLSQKIVYFTDTKDYTSYLCVSTETVLWCGKHLPLNETSNPVCVYFIGQILNYPRTMGSCCSTTNTTKERIIFHLFHCSQILVWIHGTNGTI